MNTQRRSASRTKLGGHAAGAIVDQAVVAVTSLVLMILVRRQLGSAALGDYAILINALAVLVALQTAWVGDSLTVLDRFEPRLRQGLVGSIAVFCALAVVVGSFMAGPAHQGAGGMLLFGIMVSIWMCEEVGRRLYMARFEFWQLVLNDVIYAAGAFVGLVFLRQVIGSYSVTLVVGAMAIGCMLAVLASFLQLPHYELVSAPPSVHEVGQLGKFGAWRSAQAGIRPIALYVVRLIVVVVGSSAILGDLEGARLFAQPAMTYVSGMASLLLPMYASSEQKRSPAVPVPLMTLLLVAPIVVYGAVVLFEKQTIAEPLFGKSAHVSTLAIFGWMMVAVMFAAGQPMTNVLIARKKARAIFWVRAGDSAIGLALCAMLVPVDPNLAPWGIAAGMVMGTLWLLWLTIRTAPAEEPPAPADQGMRDLVSAPTS